MGIISSNKALSDDVIECGGSFKIKLSITAEPNISANPADIVLILDRSMSMAGSPLANLKSGARKFIDIIDESTDGAKDGHIGGGSRIGIVSFSDTAVQNTQLITSVKDLKDAVDSLNAGGRTNHRDAFEKALALFDPASPNEKIMIMFTDGMTTVGGSAVPVTDAAKAQGVIIYCIGLSGSGGIDVHALNDWASDPDSAYVTITPDDAELEKIFEDLAKNSANTVPVMMPFASAYFQPREAGDRPNVVPAGSVNFAFIGNFAETPRDTVFTTEYSIRTAMEAVYTLLDIDRGVPEVWGSVYDIRDLLNATIQLRDGKPVTEMNFSFLEKIAVKMLLEKIKGTEVEKLLKEYHVIE